MNKLYNIQNLLSTLTGVPGQTSSGALQGVRELEGPVGRLLTCRLNKQV